MNRGIPLAGSENEIEFSQKISCAAGMGEKVGKEKGWIWLENKRQGLALPLGSVRYTGKCETSPPANLGFKPATASY